MGHRAVGASQDAPRAAGGGFRARKMGAEFQSDAKIKQRSAAVWLGVVMSRSVSVATGIQEIVMDCWSR